MTLGKGEFLLEEATQNPLETKRMRNYSQHSAVLSPIKVKDLHACAFNLKRCRFEIHEDHSIQLDIYNKDIKFIISNDSQSLQIYNQSLCKAYTLNGLPSKYHKFYLYGKKICEMVRSKTPKVVINNEEGKFFLMSNEPNPNFEACFKNGVCVYLKAFDQNEFRIVLEDGKIVDKENFEEMKKNGKLVEFLNKANGYLKACLKKGH